ncbi:HXXXD-type acyl-transferase family protein [Theobroma cacao]|uniref:HXXXD-type acyl-transferase family protein n=1 Tax=Theobroma cacao TaxID=3641 RepID=A0A061DI17_THECC|nr:HXXXD-type acyl-transferase family protein [Theobroma cacao]
MAGIRCISSTMVQAETHKAGTQRVELTPWDLRLLPLGPIQKGLLFPRPKPSPEKEIENTLIHHLKASLAHTLDYFPPLAGRLATTEHDDDTISFCIDCNNSGALFIHAEADGVTELVDGVFVGCTINHSVVDGSSFWHFFNSWSEISRGSIPLSKLPVFQRSFFNSINYPIRIPRSYVEQFHEEFILPPNLKERVFHFTKQSIAKLKARANAEVGTNNISSLQALLSHIWRSVIRNKNLDPNEEMIFYMLIGARPRLRDLPEQYFGNAVTSEGVKMKAKELQEQGVGDIAWQMNRIIATQTEVEFKNGLESWIASPKLVTMAM